MNQRLINNQMDSEEADVEFPHDVVAANVMGDSLIKAWREYLDSAGRNWPQKPAFSSRHWSGWKNLMQGPGPVH